MQLIRIAIRNMFQYADYTQEFTSGINLITGLNGAGKTNLLNTIRYALTGELPSTKESAHYRHAAGDGRVRLTFTHRGKTYQVTRELLGGTHELRIADGDVLATGRTAVTKSVLEEVLGVSKQYLTTHVFVPQGRLRFAVESTPRERFQWIQKLLDLESIQKLWTELGAVVSRTEGEVARGYDDELKRLQEAQEQLAKLPNPDVAAARAVQTVYEHRQQQTRLLLKEQAAADGIRKRIAELTAQRDQLWQGVHFDAETREVCQTLLPVALQYERYLQKRNELRQVFAARPRIVKGVAPELIDQAQTQVGQAQGQMQLLRRQLEQSATGDTCPACGAALRCAECGTGVGESARTHLEQEIERLEESRTVLQRVLSAALTQNLKARQVIAARERIREVLREVRQLRQVLPSRLVALDLVKQYAQFSQTDESLLTAIANQQVLLSDAEVRCKRLRQELDELPRVTEQDYNEATNALTIADLRKQLEQRIELLSGYLDKQRELDAKKARLAIVKQVRDVFHGSNVVAYLIRRYVRDLSAGINKFLRIFNAPYSVLLTDQMVFEVSYDDGAVISEKELSYGEQLMLSLCYHLAINMTEDLRFIVLDEPTLGLDEQRVYLVPELLERFAQHQDSEFQILCCTHESALTRCAAHVIALERMEELEHATV